MAKTGNVRGDVVVGDAGNPEVVIPLSLATATLTKQQSGKTVVPAAGTLTLQLSGSTAMQLIYFKVVNNSTKAPMATNGISVSPGPVAYKDCTEMLIIAYTGASITSVALTMPASDGEVEFLIAG